MKSADEFHFLAVKAQTIRPPLANQLDGEAIGQIVAGWPELQHRRRLVASFEFTTAAREKILVSRWLLPRADGVFQLADLPEVPRESRPRA